MDDASACGDVPADQWTWLPRITRTVHFNRRLDERLPHMPRDPFFLKRCLAEGRWYRDEREAGALYVLLPFDDGYLTLVAVRDWPTIVLVKVYQKSGRGAERFDRQGSMKAQEVLEVGE